MSGRTNVSLIGLGRWGKNHLRVLHENLSNEVNLVIYDANNDTVNYWNSFYNGLTVANSAEEAIKLTDATIIATPSYSHFDLALLAIENGNDVLIEKPITSSVGEASKLLLEIDKSSYNPVVMVDHILLYNEAVDRVLEIIRSGEIGRPEYYRSNRTHFGWKVKSEDVVNSLMIHDIYMMEHLLGEKIRKITGTSTQLGWDDTTTHGYTDASVEFSFRSAWVDYKKQRTIQITGSKKTLVWDDDKNEVLILPYSMSNGVVSRGDESVRVEKLGTVVEPMEIMLRHFLSCIETMGEPISGVEHGLQALLVCDMIKDAAREG